MSEPRHIDPATHSAGALRTYFNIASEWRMSVQDACALLGIEETTYNRWHDGPEKALLSPEKFKRMSYVFGIYKALQILFPDRETADGWMRRPNDAALFGGRPPIERLRSGQLSYLREACEYLEARISPSA